MASLLRCSFVPEQPIKIFTKFVQSLHRILKQTGMAQGAAIHAAARDNGSRRIPVSSLLSPAVDSGTRKPCQDSEQTAPRAPRPSYTSEQKFFIMYSRIVLGRAWPDIENDFCHIFDERKERTKGGLTSVYYRIRDSWHLKKVLANGPQSFAEDKIAVEKMARGFQPEFLVRIGYPVH